MYTGAWETILLPTSSSLVQDDINIGVYKYTADDEVGHKKGQIRAIPKQNENVGIKNGIAGGNGSFNPIIAYGISDTGSGYIETAQMK